jgi:amino acid permease
MLISTFYYTVLIQAAFAFIGTEITAIASAETANVSTLRNRSYVVDN